MRPRGVVAGQLNAWREQTLPSAPRHNPPPTRTINSMNGDNELGSVLRTLREQHRWRQRDLAALIGTQQNRVGDWENGIHQPTLAVLQRIAAAFDLTVSELLDGIM